MKEMLTFKIKMKPEPKQSAKFAAVGKHVRSYQPKKVTDYKQTIQATILSQLPDDFVMFGGPIHIDYTFAYAPLKSFAKKMLAAVQDDYQMVFKSTKPDADNLEKSVNDAMEGIVFNNDSQIASHRTLKIYEASPYIEIRIKAIDTIVEL